MSDEKKYLKNFGIYRANKSKSGAASRWGLTDYPEGPSLFLTAAKQKSTDDTNGNATFDWDNKATIKLEEPDVGEILCVLRNLKPEAGQPGKGLYHQSEKGSSIMHFKAYEKDGTQVCYAMTVMNLRDGSNNTVSHLVSFADGEVLRVLLEAYLLRKYQW